MSLYDNNYLYLFMFLTMPVLQLLWMRLSRRSATGAGPGEGILPGNTEPSGQSGDFASHRQKSSAASELLLCLLIALAAATLFRLFPGNRNPAGQDSSVFLYIGRRMAEGKLPYRDLFDHKGPYLYFLEALGCLLTPGSFTGVWLLELLNLYAAVLLGFRLCSLVSGARSSVCLSLITVFFICGWKIWQGGNFTEEYALPWILLAALVFFRFFRTGRFRRSGVFLLGLSCSAVLLLRANMVAVWLAFIPVVCVRLLRQRRFRDLGRCVLLFLAGLAAGALPALFWCLRTGCLRQMWECYVLFNLSYADSVRLAPADRLGLTWRNLLAVFPGSLALLLCLLRRPKDPSGWLSLWFFVCSLVLAQMSGRVYYHYLITLLPAMLLPLASFFDGVAALTAGGERRSGASGRRGPDTGAASVLPSVPNSLLLLTCALLLCAAFGYRMLSSGNRPAPTPGADWLLENTAPEEDVLVLGNNAWLYLAADRKTENRCFYQTPPVQVSDGLYEEFLDGLLSDPPDIVILAVDPVLSGDEPRIGETVDWLGEQGWQAEDHGEFLTFTPPASL